MRKLLLLILYVAAPLYGQAATITWGTTYQTIDGFGASDAFATSQLTTAQANLFFTEAGFSLLRTNLPDGSNGTCTTVSSSCVGNNLTDMQEAIARGAKVWATSWTPPAAMTNNDSLTCDAGAGNNALAPGSYGSFATWISNFVASLSSLEGISLYGFSVQNEPDYCPGYEGAIWTAANFDTFIKTNLGPTLATAGQSSVEIIIPEMINHYTLADTCMTDASCSQYVSVAAKHISNGSTAEAYNNQGSAHLWETEDDNGNAVSFDPTITFALATAQRIHSWMTSVNANAYLWWWLIEYQPNNDMEGLISGGVTSLTTYAIGNFARFVRPGFVRIDSTLNPQSGVYVSAYKNIATSDWSIVAINTNSSGTSQTFTLSGFSPTTAHAWLTSSTASLGQQADISISMGSFTVTLPASSIETFTSLSVPNPSGSLSGATLSNVRIN